MKISVVTTLYNAVNTLSDCLDSVAAQTHTPREHIVIDGGRVNGSLALLRQRGDQLAVLLGLDAATPDAVPAPCALPARRGVRYPLPHRRGL